MGIPSTCQNLEELATPNLGSINQNGRNYMLQVGDSAPDFQGILWNEAEISLGQFLGQKVIIYFYPKDNTPGCTTEACDFQANLAIFAGQNFAIVGISPDKNASHKTFSRKYGLTFPLISDPENIISKKYGVWKEKKNYGRTYMGIERTTFVIDENAIVIAIFPNVRVKGHIQAIIDSI